MTRAQCVYTGLESSVLTAPAYETAGILQLQFRSGAIYRYFAIPPAVLQHLLAAPSKDAYFNRNLRNRFSCLRQA